MKPPRSRWPQLELPHTAAPPANTNAVANDGGLDDFLADVRPPPSADPRVAQLRKYREQGKAANASGQAGEHWVDVHHGRAVHELHLAAVIWHVGAPWVPHVVGGRVQRDRRGRVLGAVVDVAPPDYLGFLADGRGLAVEVKRRSGRLHRDRHLADGTEDPAGIEAHQARDLARAAGTPGLSLLVAEFTRQRKGRPVAIRVAAPWRVVEARWRAPRGGPMGVGPEDLEDYILPEGCECYLTRF